MKNEQRKMTTTAAIEMIQDKLEEHRKNNAYDDFDSAVEILLINYHYQKSKVKVAKDENYDHLRQIEWLRGELKEVGQKCLILEGQLQEIRDLVNEVVRDE